MEQKQITIVVALIKNEKNEILLAKRFEPENKIAHNKWEFVGGGIEAGESPEQAIVREIKEEAGVEAEIIRLLPKILTHTYEPSPGSKIQIIMIIYECKIISGNLTPNKNEQIGELKFISKEELSSYDCLPNTLETVNLLNF